MIRLKDIYIYMRLTTSKDAKVVITLFLNKPLVCWPSLSPMLLWISIIIQSIINIINYSIHYTDDSELTQQDGRGKMTANLVWQKFCLKKPSAKLHIPLNIFFVEEQKLTKNGLPFKRFLKFKKLITFNLLDIARVNIIRNFIRNFAVSKHVTAIYSFL